MTKLFDYDCDIFCKNCDCFKEQVNSEGFCFECENKLKETSSNGL